MLTRNRDQICVELAVAVVGGGFVVVVSSLHKSRLIPGSWAHATWPLVLL